MQWYGKVLKCSLFNLLNLPIVNANSRCLSTRLCNCYWTLLGMNLLVYLLKVLWPKKQSVGFLLVLSYKFNLHSLKLFCSTNFMQKYIYFRSYHWLRLHKIVCPSAEHYVQNCIWVSACLEGIICFDTNLNPISQLCHCARNPTDVFMRLNWLLFTSYCIYMTVC